LETEHPTFGGRGVPKSVTRARLCGDRNGLSEIYGETNSAGYSDFDEFVYSAARYDNRYLQLQIVKVVSAF